MLLFLAEDSQTILARLRYEISCVSGPVVAIEFRDGESLLQAVAQVVPDVIVLDVHLPGKGALDVLPLLSAEIPVIVISGSAESLAAVRALGRAVVLLHKDRLDALPELIDAQRSPC